MRNPALGLVPLLVFSLLIRNVDIRLSSLIALALSVIGFFLVNRHSRWIYKVSIIAFTVSLVWALITFADIYYFERFVVVEIIFVLSLIAVRLTRPKVLHLAAKRDSPIARSYLNEAFRVAFQTQYGLSIHLMFVLLLHIFRVDIDIIMIMAGLITCQIILIIIILKEEIRLRILDKKLQSEEWLPIVNEEGSVTGRVAKSVTKEMKNKYMHPVVRVAFIYDGKIYLQERKPTFQLDPGKLDYPIEKFVLFQHEIGTTVKEYVKKIAGEVEIPLRFILKYVFENELVKRLVLLYVSDISDEKMYNSINLQGGKLWTTAQIDDNMGEGIFSECFELEYEYLKNTVLLVNDFLGKVGSEKEEV